MSDISPKQANGMKAKSRSGGGKGNDGDFLSLVTLLAIIGALVMLITVVIVLLWDPSNVCERLRRGEILAMGATNEQYFDAIDTTFRGLYVPYAALNIDQRTKSARVDMLEISGPISLEQWVATNLTTTGEQHFTTGFLFEHPRGTMAGLLSEDRQKVAINVFRLSTNNDHHGRVNSHPFSEKPIEVHLPPGAALITHNTPYQRNSDVSFYNPHNGTLNRLKVAHLLNSVDGHVPPERIELTEYFPKGLSLDGGYKEPDVGRLLAWTHSGPWSGGILLLDVGESKVVKLPYEQFFNCELPGGLGSSLLKKLIIGGVFLLILIIICVILACKALFTKRRDRAIKKTQQMSGKLAVAPGSTAGQSTANSPGEANQIKMAPSIAGKLGQGKSVRKLSTSWSKTRSLVSSTAGGGSTASTLSSTSSKASKASAVSSVVVTTSSSVKASSSSAIASKGTSKTTSAVSTESSSVVGGSSSANTSSFSKEDLGSSAISSNAGGSSRARTSKPATPTKKAGASKAAVSPASSKGGTFSPGAAASSKALSLKTNAAGTSKGALKATSPTAGTSKASTSKSSSVVDSKVNNQL